MFIIGHEVNIYYRGPRQWKLGRPALTSTVLHRHPLVKVAGTTKDALWLHDYRNQA